MDQPNKTLVMSGATSDIGKATLQCIKSDYKNIVLIGKNSPNMFELLRSLEAEHSPIFIESDFTKTPLFTKEELYTLENLKTDTLLNLAGFWHKEDSLIVDTPFERINTEDLKATLDVGVYATMQLTRLLLPNMKQDAKVITISSAFRNTTPAKWIPYYTSNKAIESFTEALSLELQSNNKNINITCVAPSFVATRAVNKFFKETPDAKSPEDIAYMIQKIIKSQTREFDGKTVKDF